VSTSRPLPWDTAQAARRTARAAFGIVRGSDLALGYGAVVVLTAVLLALLPDRQAHQAVLDTSTNLANLRSHPVVVLLASAFVVSALPGLWLVPFLMLAYAAAQRWVGRVPVVVVALIGHVGATLFTAVLLVAGVTHGRLAASVAHQPDVGVSYGLACVAGLLTARVPRRWKLPYAAVLVAFFVVPLLVRPTFTDVGHTVALGTGFGLALLVFRTSLADAPSSPGAAPGPV